MGLSTDDLQKVVIRVDGSGINQTFSLNRGGYFELPINRTGKFQISLLLPTEKEPVVLGEPNGDIKHINGSTEFSYEAVLTDRGCDNRTLLIGYF